LFTNFLESSSCMKASYKIIQRTDFTKKDGTKPICIRLTINRKIKNYSLNISCNQDHWNETKSFIKDAYDDNGKSNLIIANAKAKTEKILFDYALNNKVLTFVDFEREFFAPIFQDNSFHAYLNYTIKETDGILSKETIRTHLALASKLKKFRPNLSFTEISTHFLDSYKTYLIRELKNNQNTYNKSLVFIKSMLNRAVKDGAIKINPVKEYKIHRVNGTREFLTIQELQKLEDLMKKNLKPNLRQVLKYFLFACYTGLRYQDIKNLKYGNIDNNMITILMHKTKERVTVPMIKKSRALLGNEFPEQKVFKVFVNQVTNRYLKELAGKAQIKKKISFHCSRHTFATVSMELGIPIEYVSSLLGHKDLKTTRIYAKILDYKKIEAMKKWENLK